MLSHLQHAHGAQPVNRKHAFQRVSSSCFRCAVCAHESGSYKGALRHESTHPPISEAPVATGKRRRELRSSGQLLIAELTSLAREVFAPAFARAHGQVDYGSKHELNAECDGAEGLCLMGLRGLWYLAAGPKVYCVNCAMLLGDWRGCTVRTVVAKCTWDALLQAVPCAVTAPKRRRVNVRDVGACPVEPAAHFAKKSPL